MAYNSDHNSSEKIVVRVDPDLEELIPEFLENRHKDIKSITQLLTDGNFEDIRLLGHSMRGSGGGYGFDRISEIGKSIEAAAKEGHHEIIMNSTDELSTYLNRVEISYE